MQTKLRKAENNEVFKFEKEGDSIAGKVVKIEESKLYPGSYALTLSNPSKEHNQVCFINQMLKDKFDNNSIKPGQEIMITFNGLKKNKDGTREYKDFDLYY